MCARSALSLSHGIGVDVETCYSGILSAAGATLICCHEDISMHWSHFSGVLYRMEIYPCCWAIVMSSSSLDILPSVRTIAMSAIMKMPGTLFSTQGHAGVPMEHRNGFVVTEATASSLKTTIPRSRISTSEGREDATLLANTPAAKQHFFPWGAAL